MNMEVSPLTETDRLSWVDAARGLAILGIFMVNVPAFNAPYFMYGGEAVFWSSNVSHTVQAVIDIFFQASFYTLFSFMFGFGLQMMKDRVAEKGAKVIAVILRRLGVLTCFGIIHAFFIWHGDILLTYGILGFVLLAFFYASNRVLLSWAFGMLIVYIVPLTLLYYNARSRLGTINQFAISQAKQNYGQGTITDIWEQNLNDWLYSNAPSVIPFLACSLIPMFLFGMVIARKRWLHEPLNYMASIKKWWGITGVLFILFKAGPYLIGSPEWTQLLQDGIGGSASAVFYVLSITLLFQTRVGAKVIFPLTWVGRMSLSNYIFQSLLCFFLFYSVGLGWYAQVSPLESFLLVTAVYALQIFLSKQWLRKYKYGPLEWLWRSLTYNKKQPMKRKQTETSY
ncbi:DUF418 domain-containing protein [Halobacillus salinarum]|uniref:DUF418 domain-containing protein n=1 Tax=Halobacillus salinarum TaxID=2932257 RepID=A0ABY4EH45_9BACI|nr:DUF418 domain-containing protein [Halobacillus salinarum]UOQ43474.1 DUF418 domain-containing protein [Halobacillus salinarum]